MSNSRVNCPKCESEETQVVPGALPDWQGVEMECLNCGHQWDQRRKRTETPKHVPQPVKKLCGHDDPSWCDETCLTSKDVENMSEFDKMSALENISPGMTTVHTKPKSTGWVRYKIHSRGSLGQDQWFYAPWSIEGEDEDLRDHILHNLETWAIHSEYYRIEFWRDEVPPVERIEKQLVIERRNLENIKEKILELEAQVIVQRSHLLKEILKKL